MLLLLLLAACPTPSIPDDTPATDCFDTIPNAALEPMDVRVSAVYDGDTIAVDRWIPGPEGDTNIVRLTCVETAEVPDECWGNEAGDWLRERIEGQWVRLVFDQELDCAFGRVCAWIQFEGATLNVDIVRAGQGVLYAYYVDDHTCCDEVRAAEEAAEADGLGGWAACEDFGAIDAW